MWKISKHFEKYKKHVLIEKFFCDYIMLYNKFVYDDVCISWNIIKILVMLILLDNMLFLLQN